jgi:tRNA U34 2-thiouridine synthase MnmA/TrmU
MLPGAEITAISCSATSPYWKPGPILTQDGQVQHQAGAYTIGQRKGLGIVASEPLYVYTRPERNA